MTGTPGFCTPYTNEWRGALLQHVPEDQPVRTAPASSAGSVTSDSMSAPRGGNGSANMQAWVWIEPGLTLLRREQNWARALDVMDNITPSISVFRRFFSVL